MRIYADTNFFTRYYLEFQGIHSARALLENANVAEFDYLPVTWLTGFELANAFQLMVYFGRQKGHARISPEFAGVAQSNFEEDVKKGEVMRPVELAVHHLWQVYQSLVFRHTAKHGFRVYDVLHVASALVLSCDTFWSFDIKAKHLATLEGLAVNG